MRMGTNLRRPSYPRAGGTASGEASVTSRIRRVSSVTGAARPRRSPATQMISPSASSSGMRERSQRGMPASMRKVLSRRSPGPPHGRKRSPTRRARTVSRVGNAIGIELGAGGIAGGHPAPGTDEAARGEPRAQLGQRQLARHLPGALAEIRAGRGAHAHPRAAALAAHPPEPDGPRPAPGEHEAQRALAGRPLRAAAPEARRRRAQDLGGQLAGQALELVGGQDDGAGHGAAERGHDRPRLRLELRLQRARARAAPRVSRSTASTSQAATRNGRTSWRIRLRRKRGSAFEASSRHPIPRAKRCASMRCRRVSSSGRI